MQHALFKTLHELASNNIHRYDGDRLYKYVDAEGAKRILENGSLKFSSPTELDDNDFEIDLLNFNLNAQHQRRKISESIIKADIRAGKSLKQVQRYLASPAGKAYLESQNYIETSRQSYRSLHDKIRLFCATTTNDNKRLWDQYANKGTGVCIEYSFPSICTKHYVAFKVFYDPDFLSFDLFDDNGKELFTSIYRWAFTKRAQYAFEDEIRLVTTSLPRIVPFPRQVFTAVYYGPNTSQSDIDDIERLLQNGYSFTHGRRI